MRDTEDMEAEVEFDDDEEPSFSDPEDFVDDISDEGTSLLENYPPVSRPTIVKVVVSLYCYKLCYRAQ